MEENFSMKWNMEWKILGMEWKWNGRKFPAWNMEKSSSIPYHALHRGRRSKAVTWGEADTPCSRKTTIKKSTSAQQLKN